MEASVGGGDGGGRAGGAYTSEFVAIISRTCPSISLRSPVLKLTCNDAGEEIVDESLTNEHLHAGTVR